VTTIPFCLELNTANPAGAVEELATDAWPTQIPCEVPALVTDIPVCEDPDGSVVEPLDVPEAFA
jgi:hypothetical protein